VDVGIKAMDVYFQKVRNDAISLSLSHTLTLSLCVCVSYSQRSLKKPLHTLSVSLDRTHLSPFPPLVSSLSLSLSL
jgi:hypothetical protein